MNFLRFDDHTTSLSNNFPIEFAVVLIVSLTLPILIKIARTGIHYDMIPGELLIFWFGFEVRKIPLDEITAISTKSVWWAENWSNLMMPGRRRLVIRRRNGFFKNLIISPEKPYVFKSLIAKSRADYLQLLEETRHITRAEALAEEMRNSSLAA